MTNNRVTDDERRAAERGVQLPDAADERRPERIGPVTIGEEMVNTYDGFSGAVVEAEYERGDLMVTLQSPTGKRHAYLVEDLGWVSEPQLDYPKVIRGAPGFTLMERRYGLGDRLTLNYDGDHAARGFVNDEAALTFLKDQGVAAEPRID